jgi:glycosyltransferase involved in cell wall biosynthesis
MSGTLRICLTSMAPFLGGAEIALERMAKGLRERGHEILTVLGCRGETEDRIARSGICVEYAQMHLTDKWHVVRTLSSRFHLRSILRSFRPHIIHSNDLPTHQATSSAAMGLGVPKICHHRYPFGSHVFRWLNKYGCDCHVFVSHALRGDMAEAMRPIPDDRQAVIHDGLELPPSTSPSERNSARGRLGLGLDRAVVLFAGQVIERKGVADLLRAWSLLDRAARARAELVIVGDDLKGNGQYRREMEQLASDLDCPARFVGFRKNVSEWLSAADIAVVPSHVEPLGNAVLEAMSHGLPVVATRVGGIPEMVADGETGILVAPHAADELGKVITRLVCDLEHARTLGVHGRRRCEGHFSLQSHVDNVENTYRQLLERQAAVLRTMQPVG